MAFFSGLNAMTAYAVMAFLLLFSVLHVCGGVGGVSSVMRINAHDSSFCGRSLGDAFADAGFRACGHEAVAFRSPPPPLRAPTYKLVSYQT